MSVATITRQHKPTGPRTIHLVDLENLLGGTHVSEADARAARAAYLHTAAVGPMDVVVVATSHVVAQRVWFGWPDARRLVRSGPDGADRALLDVIREEAIAGRFDRVVIASGDGIFAEACAQLQAAGCQVTAVSRPESLSRRLAFAVRDIRFLCLEPDVAPLPAALKAA